MATGIAAAINAVGFHIVNAAGANMSVATARMEMVLTIAPVLAPTAFPLALAGAATWLVAPRGLPCGRGLRGSVSFTRPRPSSFRSSTAPQTATA